MAKLSTKQAVDTAPPDTVQSFDIDLESAIADELLASVDWAKVKTAMLKIAKRRFIAWLSTDDRPVNICAFPELAQIEGSEAA